MNNLLSNYPDIIGIALIPMIIAIFAIALPLLLQTISRIDDKYSSTKLIETFKKDPICIGFITALIITILAYIIWMLHLPRIIDGGSLNGIIDNSGVLFVAITTLFLITMTFAVVYLTYVYFVPEKLIKNLIKKYNQSVKHRTIYFEAISKILFYSIQKADEPLARELLDFYFETFINFRKAKEGTIIEYPPEYYDSVFEANELLCIRTRRTVSFFNDSTLFELFLDEHQHTIISPKTYRFIWVCLLQALRYKRDDFAFAYWKKAHQLCNIFLTPIEKKFDDKFQILNNEDISKREDERKIFIEFHYAFGGLLMYLENYDLVKKITNWTSQKPPKYVLVPETMEEVISRFMKISYAGGYINPAFYEQKYPFPDISGVDSDNIIQMWIKRYLSILFLRQYTLHDYYTYSDSLRMPNPPNTLPEMTQWNEELETLKYYVNYYLSENAILDKVGLTDLCKEDWFHENQKETPSALIDKLKTQIDTTFEKTKLEQDIDPGKLEEFKKITEKILTQTYNDYSILFDNNIINDKYKNFFIGGRYQLMEKAGFAKNQEISYVNSDSIVAEIVSNEFKYISLNVFILMQHNKYLLKEEDIFPSIANLALDSNNFVIVAIGVNIHYFSILKVKGLEQNKSEWSYNQIKIICLNNYMNELVSQSLFIIRKEDLPSIVHNEVLKEKVEKFGLDRINERKNIYASILNLYNNEYDTIKDEITKNTGQEDLSKSVLVCVDINTEIRYKLGAKCIQLKVFSHFDDRGTVNNLSDVQSMWGD